MIVDHFKCTKEIIYQGLSNCRSLQYQWYFRPEASTGESLNFTYASESLMLGKYRSSPMIRSGQP